MIRAALLLALALSLLGCRGSMVVGPPSDDDDSASVDDDDVAPDDDDVAPDDDDVGPTDELGFFVWDATEGENGGPGPTYAYMVLPRGSLNSCMQWLQNSGEDVDYDYVTVWTIKGPTASWDGDYAEVYGPYCDYENPASRCFSAWGYDGSWQQGFESGPGDELTVDAWSGSEASGSIELGDDSISFRAENCGELDFMDDEGDETDPNPDGARAAEPTPPAEAPARRGGWKLRLR